MKKFKLAISLALATLMVVSLFSACQKTSTTSSNKNATIQFMMISDKGTGDKDFLFKKIFKEKFNVDVNFIINPMETHMEKLKLMMSSNNLPDIISPLPSTTAKEIGAKNMLVPINQYLEKLPNFNTYLSQDKKIYSALQAADGNIYSLPGFNQGQRPRYVPIIRGDLFKELNLPLPRTMDELHSSMLKIKDKYPNIKGIVNMEKMNFISDYGTNYNTNLGAYYDATKDKFVFAPLYEGFKQLITDFNGFYKDGLLDSDFFTAGDKQWKEKFLNGEGLFSLSWPDKIIDINKRHAELNPQDAKYNLQIPLPLTTKTRDRMYVQTMENVNDWTSWGISSKSTAIETILKMADYMYSDEGIKLAKWGPNNEYSIEQDGKYKFKENVITSYNANGTLDLRTQMAIGEPHMMRVSPDDDLMPPPKPISDTVYGEYKKNNITWYMSNNFIRLSFTQEEQQQLSKINTSLGTMVTEDAMNFITGKKPLSDFDDFTTKLKQNGAQDIETIYAAAYNRYKNNLSSLK